MEEVLGRVNKVILDEQSAGLLAENIEQKRERSGKRKRGVAA